MSRKLSGIRAEKDTKEFIRKLKERQVLPYFVKTYWRTATTNPRTGRCCSSWSYGNALGSIVYKTFYKKTRYSVDCRGAWLFHPRRHTQVDWGCIRLRYGTKIHCFFYLAPLAEGGGTTNCCNCPHPEYYAFGEGKAVDITDENQIMSFHTFSRFKIYFLFLFYNFVSHDFISCNYLATLLTLRLRITQKVFHDFAFENDVINSKYDERIFSLFLMAMSCR